MHSDLTKLVTARRLARTGEGRRIRERADLTVKELAAAAGIDTGTLHRWEDGRTTPRAPAALRWVDALVEATAIDDAP
jgi:DNA-binding transcriptional regulator YiaG